MANLIGDPPPLAEPQLAPNSWLFQHYCSRPDLPSFLAGVTLMSAAEGVILAAVITLLFVPRRKR